MQRRLTIFALFALTVIILPLLVLHHLTIRASAMDEKTTTPTTKEAQANKVLKDVGEAYMDQFGLTDADFKAMKKAGITIIEGNFDICASDEDITYFLNKAKHYNMKVIMPAGSGEAEWGYTCDQESYPATQKPVWQKTAVTQFINKWKSNTAIYAWDTSNEAGSVMPNAKKYMLTLPQLQTAYKDVKKADPTRPVMIRMNGWFFYDSATDFFKPGNPFGKDITDIVMVNAYSNVEDYYPDFVRTVMRRAQTTITQIDPSVTYMAALGTWSEAPMWTLHTPENLNHDIYAAKNGKQKAILAFFKYGAKGSEWYLPTDAPALWKVITDTK